MNSNWANKLEFVLYHTLGCHLCELAEGVVAEANLRLVPPLKIIYKKVDIAEDPQLFDQFGIRIPVLKAATTTATLD